MNTEISSIKKQEDIDANGWEDILVDGHKLTNVFHDVALVEIKRLIDEDCNITSHQLSYIGYSPERGNFLVGFDTWLSDESQEYSENIYELYFEEGAKTIIVTDLIESPKMMYSDGSLNYVADNLDGVLHMMLK